MRIEPGADEAGVTPSFGAPDGRSASISAAAQLVPEAVLASVAVLLDEAVVVAVEGLEKHDEPTIVWANDTFGTLFGYDAGAVLGCPVALLEDADRGTDDRPRPWSRDGGSELDAILQASNLVSRTVTLVRGDRSKLVAWARSTSVEVAGHRYWLLLLREASDEVRADDHLRASEERFRALAERAPIGIFSSDVGLRLGYVNDRYAELLGAPDSDLLGVGWLAFLHPDDIDSTVEALHRVLEGEEIDLPTLRILRPDGEARWVHARAVPVRTPGKGAGFVGSLEDVTERITFEAKLSHQALHDPLTGLPNRVLLWERLNQMLAERRRTGAPVTLLFLDLDNFKLVNDSLGHDVGDRLLVAAADRLSLTVRPGDLVARFGGDEFVVVCGGVGTEATAAEIATRLLAVVQQPVELGGADVTVTASMGIVVANEGHQSAEALVRDADVAMYQAKNGGKARSALFDERVRSSLQLRLTLVNDLRRAIEQGTLSVAYQPIVATRNRNLVSVEALVRWVHPERGLISPTEFVSLAEENGLIVALGGWVLRTACRQLAEWRERPGEHRLTYVSVNLSTVQLSQRSLHGDVSAALAESGLQGSDLCLEITESMLMDDPEASIEALQSLKALGVRLAIDDFGTGYSSLTYLRRFPVDFLKVDGSFVAGLGEPGEEAIASAIVALGRTLGIDVVAEGVETPAQLAELERIGCAYAQGFHLGRPVPPEQLGSLLAYGGINA